jgi:hypothetical protein
MNQERKVETAILECFISPNESDRNMEAANVVDGLFAIARSISRVAEAIERLDDKPPAPFNLSDAEMAEAWRTPAKP